MVPCHEVILLGSGFMSGLSPGGERAMNLPKRAWRFLWARRLAVPSRRVPMEHDLSTIWPGWILQLGRVAAWHRRAGSDALCCFVARYFHTNEVKSSDRGLRHEYATLGGMCCVIV